MHFALKCAVLHWYLVIETPVWMATFEGVVAVEQDCCQLGCTAAQSNKGMQLALERAALHWGLVIARL